MSRTLLHWLGQDPERLLLSGSRDGHRSVVNYSAISMQAFAVLFRPARQKAQENLYRSL